VVAWHCDYDATNTLLSSRAFERMITRTPEYNRLNSIAARRSPSSNRHGSYSLVRGGWATDSFAIPVFIESLRLKIRLSMLQYKAEYMNLGIRWRCDAQI